MNRNKKIVTALMIGITILLNVLLLQYQADYTGATKKIYVDIVSSEDVAVQASFADETSEMEDDAQTGYFDAKKSEGEGTLAFDVPVNAKDIQIAVNSEETDVQITNIYYYYYFMKISCMDVCDTTDTPNGIYTITDGKFMASVNAVGHEFQKTMNIVFCVILDLAVFVLAKYMFQLLRLVKEVVENRVMILRLGKNDFKTRFAGSYLGMMWAFVQPIVTIMVYWFVFEVGFRSSPVDNFPFVLWLTAGMVPWFFFSEGWGAGTNSLVEYSYLVKKVVFNISTIPIVKIISALFIHAFFVGFMLFLYVLNGYMPNLYWLQLFYYSFCMIVMVIGLSYLCSAIMVFFRDLSQIIGVVLQVGIWLSCIMWSVDMLPERFRFIMYFNPIYYVVSGYRNALINEVWFWEIPYQTMGFWIFNIILMSVGFNVFNKLRVHFADVL